MAVIMMDSTMTSFNIEAGFAPIAFRMPNSRVRSRTVINMMLLTPTIPAIIVAGVLAGYFPARKAVNVSAIEAMRTE